MPRSPTQSEPLEDILRNVRPSPKLTIDKDGDGNHSKQRPRLLFRAFQPEHGFTARRFLNHEGNIPRPPKFGSPEFLREIEPHLRIDRTYPSPVLSFTQSPKYAMKIVRRSDPERSLAVFDILQLEEDFKTRFRKGRWPHLVRGICAQYDLYDLPGGYVGTGEWLIWANVKCQPVAIFDKTSTLELHKSLRAISELKRGTGEQLGRLLKDVSDEYKEILARKLLVSFNVPGCEMSYNRRTWNEFADAMYSITRGNRERSVVRTLHGTGDSNMREALEALRRQGEEFWRRAQAAAATGPLHTNTAHANAVATADADAVATAGSSPPTPVASFLEGLEDYIGLSLTPSSSTPPPPPPLHTTPVIDLTRDSTGQGREQEPVEAEPSTEREPVSNPADRDSDDESFLEVEMEMTITPTGQQHQQEQGDRELGRGTDYYYYYSGDDDDADGNDDDDLVIISWTHPHQH